MPALRTACLLLTMLGCAAAAAGDGNRMAVLDEYCSPYWPAMQSARLTTPQWVGQPGVEAAVVLSVDDVDDLPRYEAFLRPIFDRLKKIDGRAPVSLMARKVEPGDPQLQAWMSEGVSIECHTYDHPCPCLQTKPGKLPPKETFDRNVDLIRSIPHNRPVAFRMPCCDSMNSVSPRFFAEIFAKTTPAGGFLSLDASVFHAFTRDDPALPRQLVDAEDGQPRFLRYEATDRRFVNYIVNYPYPYVIGRTIWELPCVMPDDWLGFHRNGPADPQTVADLKAALDATMLKQGLFVLTFHAHKWIKAEQVVELIDYVEGKFGRRMRFVTFRELEQGLTANVLGGQPLRDALGRDNGARVLDLNGDGYMDAVIGNAQCRQTRLWCSKENRFLTSDFPVVLVGTDGADAGARFGLLRPDGMASLLVRSDAAAGLWHFDGKAWQSDPKGLAGLDADGPVMTLAAGCDRGVRLRDLDRDGRCELIVGNPQQNAVFGWKNGAGWSRLGFGLPLGTVIVDAQGRDAGLRFVDINEDGFDDVVFSDSRASSVDLFVDIRQGWARRVCGGPRGNSKDLPMIVRADGTNNGAWFKDRHMWVQNEDTGGKLPHQVDVRSYKDDILTAGQ